MIWTKYYRILGIGIDWLNCPWLINCWPHLKFVVFSKSSSVVLPNLFHNKKWSSYPRQYCHILSNICSACQCASTQTCHTAFPNFSRFPVKNKILERIHELLVKVRIITFLNGHDLISGSNPFKKAKNGMLRKWQTSGYSRDI
jgi:hypothetical protein